MAVTKQGLVVSLAMSELRLPGKILCCLNFNEPFYQNIPFLKSLYEPWMDVVVYGPNDPNNPLHPDVNLVSDHQWYFSYRIIVDAVQRYPGYDGYLFLQDDVILNLWNLQHLDPSKIWMPQPIDVVDFNNTDYWWYFWQQPKVRAITETAYKTLPAPYQQLLTLKMGRPNAMAWGFADCFYIPANLASDVISVFSHFAQHQVFLELAVPMGLMSISPQWESLTYESNPRYRLPWLMEATGLNYSHYDVKSFYSHHLHVYHPIKCSDKRNQAFIQQQFRRHLNSNKRPLWQRLQLRLEQAWFRLQFWAYALPFWVKHRFNLPSKPAPQPAFRPIDLDKISPPPLVDSNSV